MSLLERMARPARAACRPLEKERDAGSAVDVAFGPLSALAMSVWCGLFAGLAELGLMLIQKAIHDPSPLFFRINRNVVWTIPTVNLALFGLVGLVLALVVWVVPRRD